jgi:methyltransferase (TIGR00027 family)
VPEQPLAGVHRTAFGAAAVRALHLHRDGEPKILVDDYALRLLGITVEDADTRAPRDLSTAGWVCRARFAEDEAVEGWRGGIRQYVVLGAGLDSFALRRAAEFPDLYVYEVDDPPLSDWKQQRLADLAVSVPSTLRFAPCDFEVQTVAAALDAAGFNSRLPAVVSWLGVTQYLSVDAVAETLRWAASLASGSEIVLTYVIPGPHADAEKARHAAEGTRFETFFTQEEIAEIARTAGLEPEIIAPEALDGRYFDDRDDGLKASRNEHLLIARRP